MFELAHRFRRAIHLSTWPLANLILMDTTDGRGLPHEDSRATLISLLQLDPLPIDASSSSSTTDKDVVSSPNDDYTDKSDGMEPSRPAKMPESAGHSSSYYLSRIQRYSSYATGIFAAIHITNVSLIPAITRSVPGSETYLLMAREIYQTPLTEPLVVAAPVLAHVGSGIALRLLRRWQNMNRYGGNTPGMFALQQMRDALSGKSVKSVRLWPALSYISISGYAFTLCWGAHVFLNRVLPLNLDGDSSNVGLAYVAHGFARHPFTSYAAYLALLGTASGHMVWGMAKWLGKAPSTKGWRGKESVIVDRETRRQRRRKWLSVHGAVAGVAALWAIGGLGVVARGGLADGWVGKVYDELFGSVGL